MKRAVRLLIFPLLLSLLVVPFFLRAADADVLADVRDRWMFALKEGDAAKLASLFAENATIMPPGFPSFTGRKAIEGFYSDGFLLQTVRAVELHAKERYVGKNSVREHGTYKITWVPKSDQPPYTVTGRYLFIGAKRPDGKWEIVWEMNTIENKVPADQL
jgi:uncharacterized protein (TIGR02246 family)